MCAQNYQEGEEDFIGSGLAEGRNFMKTEI